jgi:hypothetical protein
MTYHRRNPGITLILQADGNANPNPMAVNSFAVRDCALVAIATGLRAQSLREFRDALQQVPQESVYFHFWGRLLRPRFDDTEFHNDFATWARYSLHDEILSERLAVIDPADFADVEALRAAVLEVVEQRMDETDSLLARRDRQFHFRRCQTVVFDTGIRLEDPASLVQAIPAMSLGSIYYHAIDARRREPVRTDDFRAWLAQFGGRFDALGEKLGAVDPYFANLAELRVELSAIVADHFRGAPR